MEVEVDVIVASSGDSVVAADDVDEDDLSRRTLRRLASSRFFLRLALSLRLLDTLAVSDVASALELSPASGTVPSSAS